MMPRVKTWQPMLLKVLANPHRLLDNHRRQGSATPKSMTVTLNLLALISTTSSRWPIAFDRKNSPTISRGLCSSNLHSPASRKNTSKSNITLSKPTYQDNWWRLSKGKKWQVYVIGSMRWTCRKGHKLLSMCLKVRLYQSLRLSPQNT